MLDDHTSDPKQHPQEKRIWKKKNLLLRHNSSFLENLSCPNGDFMWKSRTVNANIQQQPEFQTEAEVQLWVLMLALCRLAGYRLGIWGRRSRKKRTRRKIHEDARRESFHPLPVLQFSRHLLGDATTQQPHQEEDAHAQCYHEQDVVLGGRGHNLHCQVWKALGWRHLQEGVKHVSSTTEGTRKSQVVYCESYVEPEINSLAHKADSE